MSIINEKILWSWPCACFPAPSGGEPVVEIWRQVFPAWVSHPQPQEGTEEALPATQTHMSRQLAVLCISDVLLGFIETQMAVKPLAYFDQSNPQNPASFDKKERFSKLSPIFKPYKSYTWPPTPYCISFLCWVLQTLFACMTPVSLYICSGLNLAVHLLNINNSSSHVKSLNWTGCHIGKASILLFVKTSADQVLVTHNFLRIEQCKRCDTWLLRLMNHGSSFRW